MACGAYPRRSARARAERRDRKIGDTGVMANRYQARRLSNRKIAVRGAGGIRRVAAHGAVAVANGVVWRQTEETAASAGKAMVARQNERRWRAVAWRRIGSMRCHEEIILI